MVNDPLGDLLAQIKNAAMANKKTVDLPYSKMKMAVAKVLVDEGYLLSATQEGQMPKAQLRLELSYQDKTPVLTDLKRISKPGMRLYIRANQIPLVVGGMGIAILSTPKGVMTGKTAREQRVGGELLCKIW